MRGRAALAIAVLAASAAFGAETDNLTYRYLPLEDSAAKLNGAVNRVLDQILQQTNEELGKLPGGASAASDTEAELTFFRVYRKTALQRFYDRLLPVFEACIESDECTGWPRFERIVLVDGESIYDEARYNRIAESSLAPTINLCGVRMGTDKMTHLFSNGFFYYNASRQEGSPLRGEEDAQRAALADERGLMGARSTAVVSPADAEATVAGYRLARDDFEGRDPLFGRDDATGLLRKRRDLDVCAYVGPGFDEVANPPEFTAGRRRVERLRRAIEERIARNAEAEASIGAAEKEELKERIVERRLPASHGRLPFLYKLGVAFRWAFAYFTIPEDSRRAIRSLVFPRFRLRGRRPIVLFRDVQ